MCRGPRVQRHSSESRRQHVAFQSGIRRGHIDSGGSRRRRMQRACGPDRETGVAGAGSPAENSTAIVVEAAPADRCVSPAIDRRCAAVAGRIAHRLFGRPERSAGAAVFPDIDRRHRVQAAGAARLCRRARLDGPLVGGRQINRLYGQRGRPVRTPCCERGRDAPRFIAPVAGTNHPLPSSGDPLSWSPDGKQIAFVSATPGPEENANGDPMVITRYLSSRPRPRG